MMWGFEAADSAILTRAFFLKKKFKDILIPGIGMITNFVNIIMISGM